MSHEIMNAMVARRRELRDSDASRYGTVRLVVQTQGLTHAVCSVVVERIGGGRIQGTRLAFSSISRADSDGKQRDFRELLEAALESLRSES